jgi:hypothetical protein
LQWISWKKFDVFSRKIDAYCLSRSKGTLRLISSKIKLNNNKYKVIKINVKSKLKTTTLKLDEGKNSMVVEWPVGEENMILYAI